MTGDQEQLGIFGQMTVLVVLQNRLVDFRELEHLHLITLYQTYSAWITVDPSLAPRRWNITVSSYCFSHIKIPVTQFCRPISWAVIT